MAAGTIESVQLVRRMRNRLYFNLAVQWSSWRVRDGRQRRLCAPAGHIARTPRQLSAPAAFLIPWARQASLDVIGTALPRLTLASQCARVSFSGCTRGNFWRVTPRRGVPIMWQMSDTGAVIFMLTVAIAVASLALVTSH